MKGEWHDRGNARGDRAIHAEFAVIVAVVGFSVGLLVVELIGFAGKDNSVTEASRQSIRPSAAIVPRKTSA